MMMTLHSFLQVAKFLLRILNYLWPFPLVLKELGYGANISQFLEEAKLIASMPSDLPNTIPAIKKRLYQYMVEIAVINDRIHSDIILRSSHVEDAAALATRLSELENAATDE